MFDSEEGTAVISGIVVKVILPFYLFSAILSSGSGVDPKGVMTALGLSFAMFLISGLAALIFVPLLKAPADDKGVYLFETMCGNVTYIGIPVCAAVLGGNAAFYGSLLNIPYNLLCFSLGIWLLAGKLPLKKILNPAFLAGVLAAMLYLLQIPVPSVILDGCAFIGQATSPAPCWSSGRYWAAFPSGRSSPNGERFPMC